MDRTLTLEEVNDTFKLLRNTRCRDSSCSAYATERGPISCQTCLLDSPAREALWDGMSIQDPRFGYLSSVRIAFDGGDMSFPEDQKFGRRAAEGQELVDTLGEEGVAAEYLPEEPARKEPHAGHKAERS